MGTSIICVFRNVIYFIIIIIFTFIIPQLSQASPTDLDKSFHASGHTISHHSDDQLAKGVTLQHVDGMDKIVVAGTASKYAQNDSPSAMFVARYDTNGQIDGGFGDSGITLIDFPREAIATGIKIDDYGKIVVGGTRTEGDKDFAITRLDESGKIDYTFNNSGKRSVGFGEDESAYGMTLQEGKIVVVGSKYYGGYGKYNFAVARILQDGSDDKGFDDDGKVVTDLGGSDVARAVATYPAGKIVVGGQKDNHFALVRYLSTGELDNSFGETGIVLNPRFSSIVDIETDGAMIYALSSRWNESGNTDAVIVKLDEKGQLVKDFGQDGWVALDIDGLNDWGTAFEIDDDGKILVAGCSDHKFALWRMDSNGVLDDSFGDSGEDRSETAECYDHVAFQRDGKIVAVRTVGLEESGFYDKDIKIARFMGSYIKEAIGSIIGDYLQGAQLVAIEPPAKPSADLSIEITGGQESAKVGDEFSYELKILNKGPDDSSDVAMRYTLPGELVLIEKPFFSCQVFQNSLDPITTLNCPIGLMEEGTEAMGIIKVRAIRPGTGSNYAQLMQTLNGTKDPVEDNNRFEKIVEVLPEEGEEIDIAGDGEDGGQESEEDDHVSTDGGDQESGEDESSDKTDADKDSAEKDLTKAEKDTGSGCSLIR